MTISRSADRSRIAVTRQAGMPDAIDRIGCDPARAFLRAAWFGAASADAAGDCLIAARSDGTPFAAIPALPAGPSLLGARSVPGAYWPFRALPVAADASDAELLAFLSHADTRALLSPAWRLGPIHSDAETARLKRLARKAGWTILTRPAGRTWLVEPARLRAHAPWPRASTLKKNRSYLRKLADAGTVAFTTIRGRDWTGALLEQVAGIEAASWVGAETDGGGAKFLKPEQRRIWATAAADPWLGEALSLTLMTLDGAPIAFSFDLDCPPVQYGIASSFDPAFARFRPGRLLSYHVLAEAEARGIATIDWGAGDSGYKREVGAVPGPPIEDLLFVRRRSLAALLRPAWERGEDKPAAAKTRPDRQSGTPGADDPIASLEQLVMAGLVATMAVALGE